MRRVRSGRSPLPWGRRPVRRGHPGEDCDGLRGRISRDRLQPNLGRCRSSRRCRSRPLGCWRGRGRWRRGSGLRLRRYELKVVVGRPSFHAVLLDEPPAVVVLLDQFNDVVLLERHLALLTFKYILRLVQLNVGLGRRRRRRNSSPWRWWGSPRCRRRRCRGRRRWWLDSRGNR